MIAYSESHTLSRSFRVQGDYYDWFLSKHFYLQIALVIYVATSTVSINLFKNRA